MITICPYCSQAITDAINRVWNGVDSTFEFKCPECGKTMEIDVEMEPVFLSHEKVRI